jgi:hypothetical protein
MSAMVLLYMGWIIDSVLMYRMQRAGKLDRGCAWPSDCDTFAMPCLSFRSIGPIAADASGHPPFRLNLATRGTVP